MTNAKKRRRTRAEAGRENIVRFNQSRDGKPNFKHGIGTWKKWGVLPPSSEHLEQILDNYTTQSVSDLGGPEMLTAGLRAMVGVQRLTLGVILLAWDHLRRDGFLDASGQPQQVLKILGTYLNSFRLGQAVLGLERRQKPVDELEIIAREYSQKAEPPTEDAK